MIFLSQRRAAERLVRLTWSLRRLLTVGSFSGQLCWGICYSANDTPVFDEESQNAPLQLSEIPYRAVAHAFQKSGTTRLIRCK